MKKLCELHVCIYDGMVVRTGSMISVAIHIILRLFFHNDDVSKDLQDLKGATMNGAVVGMSKQGGFKLSEGKQSKDDTSVWFGISALSSLSA